jgi:hypothetical protein
MQGSVHPHPAPFGPIVLAVSPQEHGCTPKGAQMKEPKKAGEKLSLREQWARISLEQKLAMFVAPIFVFIITAVLIPAVRDLIWDAFTTEPTTTTPTATTTATVTGEPCAPAEQGPSPTARSAPLRSSGLEVVDLLPCDSRIEISMRNIGRQVSVVKRAEFRVRAMQTIDTHCRGAGAALPISQTYDLQLPAYDGIGQVAGVTVRQQLKPNEADAFAFSVGLTGARLGDEDPRLYQLDALVYHDSEPKPIEAGTIILAVSTPGLAAFIPSEDADSQERDCTRSNVEALRTMLSLGGVRARDLEELGQAVPAS